MKKFTYKQPLYITLGIIIITTVTLVISVQSSYTYISTKEKIIKQMKHSSGTSIASLQKNITSLIASYAVNEYDNIVLSEMELRSHFGIVVEDYNMGKILGKKSYASGKIRKADGTIQDFNPDSAEQIKQLELCFYSKKDTIVSAQGEKLGTVTVYITDDLINQELNTIITNTILNSIIISLVLIISLFSTIRLFILKPISNIISTMDKRDEEGIPTELIPSHGSKEIFTLANTINNMIFSIRDSRVKLDEQYKDIKERDERILTLSMATEQSPAAIIICDPNNIIEYVNPQFEKTSGYSSNELIGLSIEILFQSNDRDMNHIATLKNTLSSDKRWFGELTPKSKLGRNYVIRLSASAIAGEEGLITHHIYLAEDITEQKLNEEMLRNSQKMDAIGQLTGGIAHDFNNLLGIVIGNLELLKMDLFDRPEELEKIDSALAGADRGANLTRKLLNFSRQAHSKQEVTLINPFIENLHELISKSVTASIQVDLNLEENLWNIEIDPGDLQDAILNLALNARDAMPGGGLMEITTANKYLDEKYIKQNPGVTEGDYVMISVSDTGTGISKEIRERIFDPFYSTKEVGKGTGLGLSMVYSFVQRSNGHIQLYSEEGSGTTFHIYLPRCLEENDILSKDVPTELPRGTETILIVDDERELAATAKSYLDYLGYQTLIVNSGKEALDALKTTKGIELMFSDVIMPDMDGFELSFSVIKQRPDVKILLTSGFSAKHIQYSQKEESIYNKLSENLLGKPYNLHEIAVAIRRTLDRQEPF